jgi:hypothetical protein
MALAEVAFTVIALTDAATQEAELSRCAAPSQIVIAATRSILIEINMLRSKYEMTVGSTPMTGKPDELSFTGVSV